MISIFILYDIYIYIYLYIYILYTYIIYDWRGMMTTLDVPRGPWSPSKQRRSERPAKWIYTASQWCRWRMHPAARWLAMMVMKQANVYIIHNHICTYIYIHTYTYIYIYIHIHIYIYIYIYIHIYTHIQT